MILLVLTFVSPLLMDTGRLRYKTNAVLFGLESRNRVPRVDGVACDSLATLQVDILSLLW